VKAVDGDMDDSVTFSQLIGDDVAEKSFALDPFTGQVPIL
jgi:hypothetical protein